MTLTLTYNDDLSRVQIAITDLPDGVETVTVERSDNGLYWETVRGGGALPVTAGAASLDDYEFTADAENQYRVVSDAAPAGLHLPGTAGSYASTPNDPSLHITGDLDLRAEVSPTVWPPASAQTVIARYDDSTNQRSYRADVASDGTLKLQWSEDGLGFLSEVSSDAVAGGRFAFSDTLDVEFSGTDHRVHFFTADTIDGVFDQLGIVQQDAGVTSVFAGTADLEVGARDGGTTAPFDGVVHAVQVIDSVGSLVADPDFTAHATDTTGFTDSAGRTWTVHGDARIIGDPIYTGSITPTVEGVWLKSIRHPFLNRRVRVGDVTGGGRAARHTLYEPQGRSMPVAVSDVRSSPSFTITLRTATAEESRDLDLCLASGDVFFIQVPADRPNIPGGYVAVNTTGLDRFGPVSTRRRWPLPCRIVAPPGPGVVGTTMTWRTVFRLYGSWQSLINANPTWRDLLATVGSADDVVVL